MIQDHDENKATSAAPNLGAAASNLGGSSAYESDAGAFDLMDQLAVGLSPVSANAGSEVLTKIAEAVGKVIEPINKDNVWKLVPVDHNQNGTACSALAVVAVKREASGVSAYVSTLLLEGAAHSLSPRIVQDQTNGRNREVTTTIGDVWDDGFWKKVEVRVRGVVGASAQVYDVTGLVVPGAFNPEDVDAVRKLTYLATSPLAMASSGGKYRPMSVADLAKGQNLVSRADWSGQAAFDLLGRPVRNDVTLTTSVTIDNQGSTWKSERSLIDLQGYIDVNYVGKSAAPTGVIGQQAMGSQVYMAEFVISNFGSSFKDLDMTRTLFGIAQAASLDADSSWVRAFLPRGSKSGELNLRDIGAVGLDIDLGQGAKRIETSSKAGFNNQSLIDLVQTLFYRQLLVSIVVDQTGPLNWVLSDLSAACRNDPAAIRRVLTAANTLTGGRFANHFKGSGVGVFRHVVLLGTYTDSTGKERPLSDIDYLGALNLFGDVSLEDFRRWTATFENPDMPLAVRVDERTQLLRGRLENVKVNSYGHQLTLSTEFLAALVTSMVEGGLIVRPEGSQNLFGNSQQRGNLSLLNLGIQGIGGQMFANTQPGMRGGNFQLGGKGNGFGV